MPAAQPRTVARRSTAQAGKAIATVEEIEIVPADGEVLVATCTPGLDTIDQAIEEWCQAYAQHLQSRFAIHMNAAMAALASQFAAVEPRLEE